MEVAVALLHKLKSSMHGAPQDNVIGQQVCFIFGPEMLEGRRRQSDSEVLSAGFSVLNG